MKFIKVTNEGEKSVSFKVCDTAGYETRDFTIVYGDYPDGSITLVKDANLPLKVRDFNYEGMEA